MVTAIDIDKERTAYGDAVFTALEGVWLHTLPEGTPLYTEWAKQLLALTDAVEKYVYEEGRDPQAMTDWAIEVLGEWRRAQRVNAEWDYARVVPTADHEEEDEGVEEEPQEEEADTGALVRLVGRSSFNQIQSLWMAGETQTNIRAIVRRRGSAVAAVCAYLMGAYPHLAVCAGCGKPRQGGQHLELRNALLYCWPCIHLAEGDPETLSVYHQGIRRLYNTGLSSNQIAQKLAIHWRVINDALHGGEVVDECWRCGVQRTSGRVFVPMEHDGTLIATCKRCADELRLERVAA